MHSTEYLRGVHMEITALVTSFVSVILAGFAIWLSLQFFKMSSDMMMKTKVSADKISSEVARVAALFEKLYAGTFDMVRKTQDKLWEQMEATPSQVGANINAEYERKLKEGDKGLREEIKLDIASVLERQEIADEKITELSSQLADVANEAISRSREVEANARSNMMRNYIYEKIESYIMPSIRELVDGMPDHFERVELYKELYNMRREELITWNGPPTGINSEYLVQFTRKQD
jgi:hypothetical protein